MSIYHIRDQQNRDFGTFTSQEKATLMASLLKNWFTESQFRIEELHAEPVNAA